jgi:hypothetical protein
VRIENLYGFAVGGRRIARAAHSDFVQLSLFAGSSATEGAVEPVGLWIAKQDEVNHRCEQKEEHTLRHENAAGIEDQPDFVKLCHVSDFLVYQANQGSLKYVSK